jgi:hypothetical protein
MIEINKFNLRLANIIIILSAISASFWIIPRFACTSHEANVEVISGNALFLASASIAWTVFNATGIKNKTRRDSTKDFFF